MNSRFMRPLRSQLLSYCGIIIQHSSPDSSPALPWSAGNDGTSADTSMGAVGVVLYYACDIPTIPVLHDPRYSSIAHCGVTGEGRRGGKTK